MGSGAAGETTYADVKARLAKVIGHITDAEAGHDQTAMDVAAQRDDQAYQDSAGQAG